MPGTGIGARREREWAHSAISPTSPTSSTSRCLQGNPMPTLSLHVRITPSIHLKPCPARRNATNDRSFPLTPLTSTLTNFASASALTSTPTKTKDLKSFNINTYKKEGGVRVIGTRRNNAAEVFYSHSNLQHPTSDLRKSRRARIAQQLIAMFRKILI